MLVCVLGTIVLSLPVVQTRFAAYVTDNLNATFGTHISIERLRISLITWDASLHGVYVEDYQKDTLFYIQQLSTSILNLRNLSNGKLEFGDIDMDRLNFKLKTYKDDDRSNLVVFIDKLSDTLPRKPGTPPFYFSTANVNISNSKFKLIDENRETQEQLNFRDLNISAKDFLILGPVVTTEIEEMSLLSKRELKLDKLSTEFKYTKQQMRFDSLQVQTPGSDIRGNLVFNYERKDFADFLNKVNIVANFEDSTVSLDEINKLYDQFGEGKKISFSSNVNGVLNDLNTTNLFLQSDNTGIRGDFNFKNLFENNENFVLDAKIKNVTSSYYALRGLLPNILGKTLPSSFQKFGQFTIRGESKITKKAIQARININTAVGSSYADMELTDIDHIDNANYKGFVSLIDFDLGAYFDSAKLGKTTMDINVEGQGFKKENLNTEVIGQIYSLKYNDYEYHDTKVSGILKEELFDGSLVSNDENFKFNFKGLADFGQGRNNFNFIATVDYADLRKLNFIHDSISVFKGNVNMDIAGNSLDNLVGNLKFSKTMYQNKNDTYYFEDFKISSSFDEDTVRTIDINSPDIITGYMKGKFKIHELGKLVQNSIGSIYTNYKPFKITPGQQLDFRFEIYNKIVGVLFPEVKFGPNTFIRGNIVADEGDFKLTFKSPQIEAYGNTLDNIDVKVDNKNPLFNTFIAVDDMKTHYYDVKDFKLINTTITDTLFFRAEFKGGMGYNDSYNLNFYHTFNKDNKSVIGLKTSDVSFKGNEWILNKDNDTRNKVEFNKTLDSITIREVVMNNGEDEQIRLRGQLADSTYKDLQLQFKIVSLNKITPTIDSLRLDGQVNGILNVLQKDNVYLPSSNLNISNFSVNGITMGDMAIGIVGNKDLTNFVVNSQIVADGEEKFGILGNLLTEGEMPVANLIANFNGFNLEPFNPLGEGVISHIRGGLNGSVKITGEIDNPDITGELTMNNAGIGIPYLNVDYSFAPNSKVELYDQTFHFDNVRLTDVDENTKATIDGDIRHKFFKDWYLDLNVDARNDRLLILNTDTEHNEDDLYYGTGFLKGTGKIYGPTQALTIKVNGSTAKGTTLKIPISDVASVGDYSFINFIEKKNVKVYEEQRKLKEYEGLELEFDLDITPDAEVEIVVDPKTGSYLKGTGEGILLIEINTNGKFNMYGDFAVVTGQFRYKFGGILDKTFRVKPGGTISWQGSPLGAELNMEAVYSLNANPAPLLDNSGYTRRIPTEVGVKLNGELEHPTIAFDISFPGINSVVKSELMYRLQDPTVEERNAFFLLAQSTFANAETGINQQTVTGNLIQSASGLLNQVLGANNDKFDLGLTYEQGLYGKNADLLTEDRIGVTVSTRISDKILFNGRLGVPVGGVSETVVAGDVEVQIMLNEEGTLRAKIFNRENEIEQFLTDSQGYTQGIGLSYEVDFNTFKELLKKVLGRDKSKDEMPPPESRPEAIMGKDSLIQFHKKEANLKK